jgi:hypothetical protein
MGYSIRTLINTILCVAPCLAEPQGTPGIYMEHVRSVNGYL